MFRVLTGNWMISMKFPRKCSKPETLQKSPESAFCKTVRMNPLQ